MKKIIASFVTFLITISGFTQSPQKMSCQCVIRNTSGTLITNHEVGVKISVLQGSASGTVVYQEIFNPNPQTNANGLISLEIGTGFPVTGTFSGINWGSGPFFLKTEADPSGGTNYTIVGTTQLLSVPYALSAKTAETADYNTLSNKPTILNSQWTTSGSNIYYNTGNIGIGVANPASLLHVAGYARMGGTIIGDGIELNAYNTGNRYGVIDLHGDDTYSDYGLRIIRNNTGPDASSSVIHRGVGNLVLNAFDAGFLSFSTNNVERMRVTSTGNVGIGTGTPGSLFNPYMNIGDALNNSAEIMDLTIKPTNNTATLRFYGLRKVMGNNWNDVAFRIQHRVDGTDMAFVEFNPGSSGSDLAFGTANTERLRISQNGYVGIGKTSPTSMLDVNGVISVNNNKVTNVASPTNNSDAATKAYVDTAANHFVGEAFGGGIVFYVYDNGHHGLIAATVDQSAANIWFSGTSANSYADGDGINAGKYNTDKIIYILGFSSAAAITTSYQGGMFGDWYLPSKYELNLLYQQKNAVGGFSNMYYWSSTVYNFNSAWAQFFGDGSQSTNPITALNRVRAIRSF